MSYPFWPPLGIDWLDAADSQEDWNTLRGLWAKYYQLLSLGGVRGGPYTPELAPAATRPAACPPAVLSPVAESPNHARA